jgi:hypothetical protein
MSIFGSIRDAIFGHRGAPAQAAPTPGRDSQASAIGQAAGAAAATQVAASATPAPPAEPVDVEAVLTEKQRVKGGPDLNWRSSIVDLMKLLDLDSSLSNRSALATELGYTGAKDGSAEMNIWLHRRVMEELARNGGRVPATMAD